MNNTTNGSGFNTLPTQIKKLPGWMIAGGDDGKATLDSRGRAASRTVADNWCTFDEAVMAVLEHGFAGIGWVIQPGYRVLDLDKALDENGNVRKQFHGILKMATYIERSSSGTGFHVVVRSDAKLPNRLTNYKGTFPDGSALEVQGPTWFVRCTGKKRADKPSQVKYSDDLVRQAIAKVRELRGEDGHSGGGKSILEDNELIEKIERSGQGKKFRALMDGDYSGYDSPSEADGGLSLLLVFWTRGDEGQIERIMRRSKLSEGREEKWDRDDYIPNTIKSAIEEHTRKGGDYYGDEKSPRDDFRSEKAPRDAFRPEAPTGHSALFSKIKSVADIEHVEFPEPRWAVPGIVPEGFTLLSGRSKIGKSWMVLGIGIAVASGGVALGQRCEQGDVLYLALEDNDRRMQDRMRTLMGGRPFPPRLMYTTEWPRLGMGGLDAIDEWLDGHPAARLIIVDVLARVKGDGKFKRGNAYELDYDAIAPLQRVAQERNVSIIVVHHLRKGDDKDPVETISGSIGNSGPADGLIILSRSRGESTGKLFVTGRDVPETVELSVEMDPETAAWSVLGKSEEVEMSEDRRAIVGYLDRVADWRSAKAISDALDKNYDATRKLLIRMADDGLVSRKEKGRTVEYKTPNTHGDNKVKTMSGMSGVSYMSGMSGMSAQNGLSDIADMGQIAMSGITDDKTPANGDVSDDTGHTGHGGHDMYENKLKAIRQHNSDARNNITTVVMDMLTAGPLKFHDKDELVKEVTRVSRADKRTVRDVVHGLMLVGIINPSEVFVSGPDELY